VKGSIGGTGVGLHAVQTLHGAYRCFEDGAARITESLSGLQIRLLADDAITVYFLYLAVGIRNDPMATHQCCGVRKHVAIGIGLGLVVDIVRRYVDSNVALLLAHATILT
jgi:hypothetical protein